MTAMGDPFTLAVYAVAGVLALTGVAYAWSLARRRRKEASVWEKTQRGGIREPVTLHPVIDLGRCIGSGSCVEVCPEKNVLGMIDGKPKLINPSACIGHGE